MTERVFGRHIELLASTKTAQTHSGCLGLSMTTKELQYCSAFGLLRSVHTASKRAKVRWETCESM